MKARVIAIGLGVLTLSAGAGAARADSIIVQAGFEAHGAGYNILTTYGPIPLFGVDCAGPVRAAACATAESATPAPIVVGDSETGATVEVGAAHNGP